MHISGTTHSGDPARIQNFLLIDDHPMMREAIGQTLAHLLPGSATDLSTTLADSERRLAGERPYDYILLDLSLPDSRGFDALAQMRTKWPATPVIVVSGDTGRDTILRCLAMGAVGYIPKTLHADVIKHALRLILSGQVYVPAQALAGAAQHDGAVYRPVTTETGNPRALGLTDRQADVLRLILKGLPNKLICRELDLAEGTVKVHVSAVLRSLGVRTRTQAVIAAGELGVRADH